MKKLLILNIFLILIVTLISINNVNGYNLFVTNNTNLFTSSDGINFQTLPITGTNLTWICASNDSKYIYVVEKKPNANIYYSNDFGTTFSNSITPLFNSSFTLTEAGKNVDCSSDGKYVYISNAFGKQILISSNFGVNFTQQTILLGADANPSSISVSADGSHVSIVAGSGGSKFYVSNNSGVSFNTPYTFPTGSILETCISPSGQFVYFISAGSGVGSNFSSDFGLTFKRVANGIPDIASVACGDSNTYLQEGNAPAGIYVSNNLFNNSRGTLLSSNTFDANSLTNSDLNNILYAKSSNALYKSDDGITWINTINISSLKRIFISDILSGNTITPTSDYDIIPFYDNYYVKYNNFVYNLPEDKISLVRQNLGIIYTYPTFQLSGLSYSQFTFQINSSQNGFSQTICNYTDLSLGAPIYDISFDNCASAIDCGFLPSPSSFNWITYPFDSLNGRQLLLYNGTFQFSKFYPMPQLYNSSFFRFETTFTYRPSGNADDVISLLSPFNQELVNLEFITSGNNVCIYSVNSSLFLTNKQLMYCHNNYDSTQGQINVEIFFNSPTKQFYVDSTYTLNSDYKISSVFTSNNISFGYSGFKITTIVDDNLTYIDTIKVFGLDSQTILSPISVPTLSSCQYNIGSCYDTRIYFAWSNNDFTNFKDYQVCGVTGNVTSQTYSTATGNVDFVTSIFGSNLSTSTKLFYAIMVIFIAIIMIIGVGLSFDMPMALVGGLSALISFLLLILFTYIGFLPLWIVVLSLIFVAGVVAIIGKSLVSTG